MQQETAYSNQIAQALLYGANQLSSKRLRALSGDAPMRTGLAEELAFAKTKIAALEQELGERDREIETLRENVSALTTSLYVRVGAAGAAHQEEIPPKTVAEAIAAARATLSNWLVFGRGIEDQISELKDIAGPPEKLLRYFRTLADLSSELSSGQSLHATIPAWLRERGVECSRESETRAKSKVGRRRRTFSIDGGDVYCEFHAKPNDGTASDQCIRIFFTPMSGGRVGIGYVGRHFD